MSESCDCIVTTDKLLAEHNARLVVNLFGKQRVTVALTKADEKKRGKPPLMFATFCPFCGTEYSPKLRAQS